MCVNPAGRKSNNRIEAGLRAELNADRDKCACIANQSLQERSKLRVGQEWFNIDEMDQEMLLNIISVKRTWDILVEGS